MDRSVAVMVGDGEMLMASGCALELVRMFKVNSVEGSREMEQGKDGFQAASASAHYQKAVGRLRRVF